MACTNPDNPDCKNCNKSGLAILPVRYTVVPNDVDAALPAHGCGGNKVKTVKLESNKYALRTLRKGFVYLFYEKHARGSHIKWEVYSVSAGGTVWKQLSYKAITAVDEEPACSRKGHKIPASVIVIEKPEDCGAVWMAFSEHCWSLETFAAFENDKALRDRRMQTFLPAKWVLAQDYKHGMDATEANLDTIIEYKNAFHFSSLVGIQEAEFSKRDGSYRYSMMVQATTRYPVSVRRDQKKELVALMNQIGEKSKGKDNPPAIIALWDAVGIVHELNGYRNCAPGMLKRYAEERELQVSALASIRSAKLAVENFRAAGARSAAEYGSFVWTPENTKQRLAAYDRSNSANTAGRARQVDLFRYWEKDAIEKVPDRVARSRGEAIRFSEPEWRARMAAIDAIANTITGPDPNGKTHADYVTEHERGAIARAWPKYQKRLDSGAIADFALQYNSVISRSIELAEKRTVDLIAWLKSSYLQNALTEFHGSNMNDGLAFENAVGDMLFGVTSSAAGKSMVHDWVAEGKASDPNLLWRAMAFNQTDGIDSLDKLLAEAKKELATPFSEQALTAARDSAKYLAKFADTVKKALSLHNTLLKEGVKVIPTGGVEKLLLTVGAGFFQPFIKKSGDFLGAGLVRGLLLVRGGSNYAKVMALLAAEARHGPAGTAAIVMSIGHAASTKAIPKEYKELRSAWDSLAEKADTPKVDKNPQFSGGWNEGKEIRFGLVATLLQGVFVAKLWADSQNDPFNKKLTAELQIAYITLGAAVADLCATAFKGLWKDTSVAFSATKMTGGLLSGLSAWMAFKLDVAQAGKEEAEGHLGLAVLYGLKSVANLASGAFSVLTAFSYFQPVCTFIAEKAPAGFAGRMVAFAAGKLGGWAAKMFIQRALLMVVGIYINLAVLVVQFLIWYFSDDELQKWCDECAFGKYGKRRFVSAIAQVLQYEKSLAEVA
jgi:hypothetical protein